ncbi:MAG: FtsX-like permease family protein, partial [Ignavibacteriaceae bacterium]
LWADSTLFDVFTLPFISGNPKTALTQPNTVVITESTAQKFFGSENPTGKILNIDKYNNYIVTGVIKDIPHNSHFHPDLIGSLTTVQDSRNPNWLSNNYYTYFLLQKGTNPKDFERKLNEEFRTHAGPQLKSITGVSFDQFLSAGNKYGYVLEPLTSIHLTSNLDYEIEPSSSISYVYIFSAIAVAILLIACINFINLATARSERRAKEVGVRKTLGSPRSHLIGQFMAESVLMSSLAVICAVGIVEILLPLFNDMANKKMTLNLFGSTSLIPFLILLAVAVGIIAGSYPAFYLSSFRPIDVLKSDIKKGGGKSIFRNGLVVFQFTISIVLFIGTFVIYSQLNYVQTKNLGFDKEETIVIYRTDDLSGQISSFEDELRSNKDIASVTNSNGIPGNQSGDSGYWLDGTGVDKIEDIRQIFTDFDFVNTYKLKMSAGRFFSKAHPSDTAAIVVNQEVEKAFGIKNMVGKYLVLPGETKNDERKLKVVGVIKDFNYQSLHEAIHPLVVRLLPNRGFTGQFVTVRLSSRNHLSTIAYIENVWKKYAGNEAFSFNFLDENLQSLYIADKRTNKIAGIFSIIAIFIACLGLLGLAAFVTERRIKEIGIRKTLGASVPEIIFLLSKDFAKWVLIANVIAWPLAYYFMSNWLENFAYRIEMSPWIFLASGALAIIVAVLTVSSHAIKAAKANPIESLRYE